MMHAASCGRAPDTPGGTDVCSTFARMSRYALTGPDIRAPAAVQAAVNAIWQATGVS